MKIKGKRILVVDDELPIQRILRRNLSVSGYDVLVADNGEQAVEMARVHEPDLILLDLCLPGQIDGIEVCRQIRLSTQIPIIVLSALTEEKQKVELLDLGADDYLTKPFSNDELQARVRACLRRASAAESGGGDAHGPPEILCSDDGYLFMNVVSRQVRAGGQEVRLTPTEFELLRQLIGYACKVSTHRSVLR